MVYVIQLLIFEKVLDQKENNYKNHKRNQYPDGPLVILSMQFYVFSVRNHHEYSKGNNEKYGENQLSGTEHIFYFYAKLNEISSNEK